MASLFSGGVASDRLDRIQTWREEAVSHSPAQNASIATQLCVGSIAFYRQCLRELSGQAGPKVLPKTIQTKFTRNYEALALWAHGYDIAHGGLDEALLSSRRARRCYFESLTSICTTLVTRLLPLLPLSPALQFDDKTRSLKQTLDAGLVCLEDTYQDGDTIDSASATSSKAASDSIDEVIKDLEVDMDNLLALDSVITCPADRAPERPQGSSPLTWVPHQAICERVAKRFPLAKETLVQRLGKATWNSFLRCKDLREGNERRDYHEENREPVDTCIQLALPAKTLAASSRSKDSGLGSSLPTSYAETVMSYRRRDGESVKVPPLPKSASAGVPFECLLCGGNVTATTNSAWKNHLFHDLRPYICVFESCPRGDDPFDTRQEWLSHTMYHVIELNGQSDAAAPVVHCPLCLEDMQSLHVNHLIAHLEEIALGAVALHADVDSDQDTDGTNESRDSLPILRGRKHCDCGKPAEGAKIRCHNDHCPYMFFHIACLEPQPITAEGWTCRHCRDHDLIHLDGDAFYEEDEEINDSIRDSASQPHLQPRAELSAEDEIPDTIKCICGFSDDDGQTIFCETCLTWQHIDCYYHDDPPVTLREDLIHWCVDCRPRNLDAKGARERQTQQRQEVSFPTQEPADALERQGEAASFDFAEAHSRQALPGAQRRPSRRKIAVKDDEGYLMTKYLSDDNVEEDVADHGAGDVAVSTSRHPTETNEDAKEAHLSDDEWYAQLEDVDEPPDDEPPTQPERGRPRRKVVEKDEDGYLITKYLPPDDDVEQSGDDSGGSVYAQYTASTSNYGRPEEAKQSHPTSPTDPGRVEHHLPDLNAFARKLQDSAKIAFPRPEDEREFRPPHAEDTVLPPLHIGDPAATAPQLRSHGDYFWDETASTAPPVPGVNARNHRHKPLPMVALKRAVTRNYRERKASNMEELEDTTSKSPSTAATPQPAARRPVMTEPTIDAPAVVSTHGSRKPCRDALTAGKPYTKH